MKKIYLSILAITMTGCGSIYGGNSPVYNQNQYGNLTPQAIQELQAQQALAQQNAALQKALAEQEALLAEREAAAQRAQKIWEQKIAEVERSQKTAKTTWEEQRNAALNAQNKAKDYLNNAEKDAALARVTAEQELKNIQNPPTNTKNYWENAEREAEKARIAAEQDSARRLHNENTRSQTQSNPTALTPARIAELERQAENARIAAEKEARGKTSLPEEPSISAPSTEKKSELKPEKEKPIALRPSDNNITPNETNNVASAIDTTPKINADKAERTPVSELLKKAAISLGKSDLESAASHLESALRLEPNNGKILFDIANVRYHQGRYKEAESFASRSVRTGGSASMQKKAWSLIANSRKALGDNQGAISAAEKAASL